MAKSKRQQFEKLLGGKWYYDFQIGVWHCNDENRMIQRVHTGAFDIHGEPLNAWEYRVYYKDLRKSEPVRLYESF